MPTDCTETARRLTAAAKPGAPPPEQEHLPCPRCDSTNTKFCYYNNYNSSQPRHFCKSCRRYWTHGGTLRDIPVGGGTRKNAKRSRTATTTPSSSPTTVICPITAASSSCGVAGDHNLPLPATPVLVPASIQLDVNKGGGGGGSNGGVCGGFTSLLNTNGPGFLALGGFGLGSGIGPGLEDMSFGLVRGMWPFPGMVVGPEAGGVSGAGVGGNGGAAAGLGNTWQFESLESGFVGGGGGGGDCFSWPDLAISTPGNGLK